MNFCPNRFGGSGFLCFLYSSGTPTEECYVYSESIPDRLTSYNGKGVTYDTNGYVKTYDGWTYTWNKGKLVSMLKGEKSSTSEYEEYTFAYNGYGQRTQKRYSGGDASTKEMVFLYEGSEKVGLIFTGANGTNTYYYDKNPWGDVIQHFFEKKQIKSCYFQKFVVYLPYCNFILEENRHDDLNQREIRPANDA